MISLSKVFFTNVNIRLIVSTPSSKGSWRKPASYAWQRGKLSIETSIHCESQLNFNFFWFILCSTPLALVCNVSIKKNIFSDSFQNPLLTSDPGRCFWVSMFYSYSICFRSFRINLETHCWSFTFVGFLYIWINISIFMFVTFRFISIFYLQYKHCWAMLSNPVLNL